MPLPGIYDTATILLQKVLDLREQKQQNIAANIANADTPGYTPVHLEFEADLRQALAQPGTKAVATHPAHFPINTGRIEDVQARTVRSPGSRFGDRNTVDLEQEMTALAENQLLYEATAQMLNKKLGLLKYVAQGGR
ncbi:MAG: flagellar basal-body rod protein FlgB [Deltaproteobacteria bacterium RIFOXYD12_FULL_57_12]|nr:MAG: flagellar basal-body rod protein FlgB [Deltaproteobacteria bacterium RIFOXYD12_FULL_57_12]